MKKLMIVVALLASIATAFADDQTSVQSGQIRVDTRIGLFGGRLATGAEIVGEQDGSLNTSWNFDSKKLNGDQVYTNGWYRRGENAQSAIDWLAESSETADILVLNNPIVHGGRLTTNEVWSTDVVHVVRHNLVVPNGVQLTVDPEAVVKFTEEARLVVEDGGVWVAKGGWLAEFQDDEWVGGDTNMDGDLSEGTGNEDWISGVDAEDYVHVRLIDGMEQAFPRRTYTIGEEYGILPTMDRYEDGYHFLGWVTNREDTVSVATNTLAEMDCPFLYANWEAIYLNLSTGVVTFAAYSTGLERAIEIEANDLWSYETDADWLTVEHELDAASAEEPRRHDGRILIAAAQNRSETPRTAVIRVSRANGKLTREITVVQEAMERAATPSIGTADDTTIIHSNNKQVQIECTTPGVTIVYTLDGTDPSSDNGNVASSTEELLNGGVRANLVINDSLTLKAIALRFDLLDSKIASADFKRGSTLAEAMDIPDNSVVSEGDADWEVVTDETYDGISAVRSGAMTTSRTKRRESRLMTSFYGAGKLTFRWKVSCESGWGENSDYLDFLAFIADGDTVKTISGQDAGWQEVTYTFASEEWHDVEWLYTKNDGYDDVNPGQDCGWVDQVSWEPIVVNSEGRESYVSYSTLAALGFVGAGSDGEEVLDALEVDSDGDGFTDEQELLLGTDPNNASDKFEASIETDESGWMHIGYTPGATESEGHTLTYRIMGTSTLGDEKSWKDVSDMNPEERELSGYKFFKVEVDID